MKHLWKGIALFSIWGGIAWVATIITQSPDKIVTDLSGWVVAATVATFFIATAD